MADAKTGLVGVGALLVGVLLGSFVSRTGETRLKAELAQVKAELAEAKRTPASTAAMLMGLRDVVVNARPSPPRNTLPAGVQSPPEPDTSPEPDSQNADPAIRPIRDTAPGSSDREEMLETMESMWKLRAAQSRAAFVEAARVDEAQSRAMDEAVARMNEQARVILSEAMQHIDFSKRAQPRDLVGLGLEMGELYLDVDSEMRQILTPAQMDAALDAQFDAFSQLDPSIFSPLLNRLDASGSTTAE